MSRRLNLILVAALVLSSLPAQADMWDSLTDFNPNLKFGTVEVHPYYGLRGTYDDNIYKVNRDKADGTRHGCLPGNAGACSGGNRGSWYTTNSVGLGAGWAISEMHKVGVKYDFTATDYKKQPTANDSIAQSVGGNYEFKGAVLTARAWDDFINTEDPPYNPQAPVRAGVGGLPSTGGELTSRERRWQNVAGLYGEYALGEKFFFGADAQDTRHKYRSPTLAGILDRSEQRYGFKTGYKVTPKTRVFAALHRGLVRYSAGRKGANHKDWDADFGVEGQLTGKLKGRLQTGLSHGEYEDDGLVPTPSPSNKTSNWTLGGGLNWAATDRTGVDLGVSRGRMEASSVRYYVSNSANLGVTHKIDKLTLGVNGGVTVDKYSDSQRIPTTIGFTANRRDDSYTSGVNANYALMRWLSLTADYRHTRRHSIFTEEFNYKANSTSVGLRAQF